jgi:hypothetical protein
MPLVAVIGDIDLKTFFFQILLDDAGEIRFVIHHENPFFLTHLSLLCF